MCIQAVEDHEYVFGTRIIENKNEIDFIDYYLLIVNTQLFANSNVSI